MRRAAIAIALAACGSETTAPSAPAPAAPSSRDAALHAAAPIDARAVAAAPADAASPPDGPLDSLPKLDFAPPFDPKPKGAAAARYALATSMVASAPDRALALLTEMAITPHCDDCARLVDDARWHDEWKPLWADPRFRDAETSSPRYDKVRAGRLEKGVKEGAWVDDDRHWETGTYVHGKRTGAWTSFAEKGGASEIDEHWTAGERDGTWTFRRDDGSQLASGPFVHDKLDGHWTIYDEHGEVAQELDFKGGVLMKVNGERATKRDRAGFETMTFAESPGVVEPEDVQTGASAPPQ